uniref:Uncharacterized protein n=1 Tax=Timema genevievae TaxID=629358 RepID=A0A7R9PMC8_TIMGE|nr:unnamed protein product [Timema genevievae]
MSHILFSAVITSPDTPGRRMMSIQTSLLLFLAFVEMTCAGDLESCLEPCICPRPSLADCAEAGLTELPWDWGPRTVLLYAPPNRDSTQYPLGSNESTEPHLRGPHSLETLDLSHNRLETIRDFAFQDSCKLRALLLGNNELKTIRVSAFANLGELTTLILENNELESIPVGLFDSLVQLTLLNLSRNMFQHVDKKLFQNLTNLEHLSLAENQLEYLESNIFVSLKQLKTLESLVLSNNQVGYIDSGMLAPLKNLKWLYLDSNRLKYLDDALFERQRKLLRLDLQNNPLHHLSAKAFRPLENLVYLDISNTTLQDLSAESFKNNFNLRLPIENLRTTSSSVARQDETDAFVHRKVFHDPVKEEWKCGFSSKVNHQGRNISSPPQRGQMLLPKLREKPPPVHPTEIMNLDLPVLGAELNTTGTLANYATENYVSNVDLEVQD